MSAAAALHINTAGRGAPPPAEGALAVAAAGAALGDEASVRDLVEACAGSDDIAPLVRLVFDAQAEPSSPTAIDGAQGVGKGVKGGGG